MRKQESLLGIVLGGFITTFIGYRYIFFINVPIGILAFALGMKFLKDKTRYASDSRICGKQLLGPVHGKNC